MDYNTIQGAHDLPYTGVSVGLLVLFAVILIAVGAAAATAARR